MATKLKEVDVVVVGLGWTGGILAKELGGTGLKVVALERGAMRTSADYALPTIRDELRYVVRHDLMQNTARDTLTIRNNPTQEALPMRRLGSFLPGEVRRRLGRALERPHLALDRHGVQGPLALRGALRQELHSCRHDDPGLGHHLRRARALLRQVRIYGGGVRQGRQSARRDPARRQSVRGAARPRLSAAAADHHPARARCSPTAAKNAGYHPFPRPIANASRAYTNPDGASSGLPILRLLPALRLRSQRQGQPARDGDPDRDAQSEFRAAHQFLGHEGQGSRRQSASPA